MAKFMRIILNFVLIIVLATSLEASNKIDVGLRTLIKTSRLNKAMPNTLMTEVIVQCVDKNVNFLKDYGTIRTLAGPYVTLRLPLQQIEALSKISQVSFIAGSNQLQLHNDKSERVIGGTVADSLGYTADDVLIGIVDTGIDLNHPAFKTADGLSRVLCLWDQTENTPAKFPDSFDYGTYWTETDIFIGSCTSKDTDGHGTHVAGCAAQYFHPTQGAEKDYSGSTQSNLIVVKTDLSSIHILDAVYFIILRAQEIGKPVVINLSMGNQLGPHDGTDPITAAIDYFAGQNNLIVRSAGNDGGAYIHDDVNADADGETMFYTLKSNATKLAFDCWYNGEEDVAIQLVLPGGAASKKILRGEFVTLNLSNGSTIDIDNASYGEETYNNDCRVLITMSGQLPAGKWGLVFYSNNSATVHSWMYDGDPDAGFQFDDQDDHYSLANDACGNNVIVVGAAVTRNEFTALNENGALVNVKSGENLATCASFSSAGPTRDVRFKPDIVMPGSYIFAAFSNDALTPALLSKNSSYLAKGRPYLLPNTSPFTPIAAWHGTSQSSPQAAKYFTHLLSWWYRWYTWYLEHLNFTEYIKHLIKMRAKPVEQMKDHLGKPIAEPHWDYRTGWGYLDLRDLYKTNFIIARCMEIDSMHLQIEFSKMSNEFSNPANYSISGKSISKVTNIKTDGSKVNLTLDNPLVEGFRDTLVISNTDNLGIPNRHVIEKKGTIVDIPLIAFPTTWTEAESPYYIHGSVEFDADLTIEPGTILKFISFPDDTAQLVMLANLCAKGSPQKPIIFSPLSNLYENGIWQGIYSQEADSLSLLYCHISNADHAITCLESNLNMSHCVISNSKNFGVFADNCSAKIKYSLIYGTEGSTENTAGIWFQRLSGLSHFQNLTIYNNGEIGIFISPNNGSIHLSKSIIANNNYGFFPNSGSTFTVDSCCFWENNYHLVNNPFPTTSFIANPQFKNPDSSNFYLKTGSPCLLSNNSFIGAFPKYPEVAVQDIIAPVVTHFELFPNYPNPFNPATTITFQVPLETQVQIRIYNLLGESVCVLTDQMYKTGRYKIAWDGKDKMGQPVSTGLYFYQMKSEQFTTTRRLLLLK
ncbi:S8 family serine peptidase [candidate division KSB1 bacterium]|nr:S8 family serine peptidase [candidate division KSB1 bacterium]